MTYGLYIKAYSFIESYEEQVYTNLLRAIHCKGARANTKRAFLLCISIVRTLL